MITVSIIIKIKPANRREFLSTCRFIANKSRKEKGCMEFCILMDLDNEDTIRLEQRWEERSCIEKFFQSDMFSALMGSIRVLNQSSEIRINESPQTEGIETIQAAQAKK